MVVNNISSNLCLTCAAGQSRRLGGIGCGPCARGELAIDISGQNFKDCVSCGLGNCGVCSRVFFCTQCDSGLFIQPSTNDPLMNSCVATCRSDHYLNPINNTCEKCSLLFGINCLTCTQTSCNSCSPGLELKIWPFATLDGICNLNCPLYYYTQGSSIRCQKCAVNQCIECPNVVSECKRCESVSPALYLTQDKFSCVVDCPTRQFKDQRSGGLPFQCSDCLPRC